MRTAIIVTLIGVYSSLVGASPVLPRDETTSSASITATDSQTSATLTASATLSTTATEASSDATSSTAFNPTTATPVTTSIVPDQTSTLVEPTPTSGSFVPCHNLDGDFAPFCMPANGSNAYSDETYYVTWDPAYYSANTTIFIQANFVNTSKGVQAYTSAETPVQWGFVSWHVNAAWMQGYDANNLTLYIVSLDPTPDQRASSLQGPTVVVANRPPVYYQPPRTAAPRGQALYIALPAVAALVVLCVCGTMAWNRKARHIGLGNVMGRARRRGYGEGRSRAQRMGGGARGAKKGAIMLREQELTAGGVYRDVPGPEDRRQDAAAHRRNDSEGLDSLVGTPTEERHGGNFFREEIRRQDALRD